MRLSNGTYETFQQKKAEKSQTRFLEEFSIAHYIHNCIQITTTKFIKSRISAHTITEIL